MISGLPAELIDETSSYLSPGDLAQLSQTNHRLFLHCQRPLYRKVDLASCLAVASFFHSLLRNGALAPLVKELKISFREPIHGLLTGYDRLIARVAPSLVNLAMLSAPYAPRAFHGLSTTHFPRLTDCTIPNSNDMLEFLRHHRALVTLEIKHLFAWHRRADTTGLFELYGPHPEKPISLPTLRSYTGPPRAAVWISRERCSALNLAPTHPCSRRRNCNGYEIRSLASSAVTTLEYFPRDWTCTFVVSDIRRSFPNLVDLVIQSPRADNWKGFLAVLERALHGFKNLEFIGLAIALNYVGSPPETLSVEEQRARAYAWGEKCPTLRELYIANTRYHLRNVESGGTEWYLCVRGITCT